jgi:hypothetical protein
MTEHPKIAGLSNAAFRLHVEGLCYSARTLSDGLIPAVAAKRLLTSGSTKAAQELVAAGVWESISDSFLIHDYHDYQPTKAKVLELREIRAKAGRLGGRPKANPNQNAKQNESKPKANAKQVRETPVPSRPLMDTDLVRSVSQAVEKPRTRNDQWDGLVAVFGYSPSGAESSLWGKLVKQLAEFGATKPSIEEAAKRYRLDMPTVTLTPAALARHYQRLMAAAVTPRANGRVSPADATLELARQAREKEIHAGQ